jgi:PAS domain S-box-containing protein
MNPSTTATSEHQPARATTLALRLAHAENALLALTSGQVDAIIDPDGKPYLLRPAQEHIRQKHQRLQTLLESAADIITILDRGGRIVSQTRAAFRVLGHEPGWMVATSFFDYVHPEEIPQVYAAFFNVIEELQPDAFVTFRHEQRDGSYRMLETMVSKLRDASAHQVVLVSRDAKRRRAYWPAAITDEPAVPPSPSASATALVPPPEITSR